MPIKIANLLIIKVEFIQIRALNLLIDFVGSAINSIQIINHTLSIQNIRGATVARETAPRYPPFRRPNLLLISR